MRARLDVFFRDGDTAAMEEIVHRSRSKLVAAARRIAGAEDAEDAVQAAYHSLLRRGSPPEGPVLPWLLVAVVRIAYRFKAMRRREQSIVDCLAHPRESPPGAAARAEEARLLHREIARLPAKYRDVVVLHHMQELPVADTATLLDIATTTVTTRLSRARRLLKGRLAPLFACFLLGVPWLVADALRTTRVLSLGVAMNVKQACLVTGVILAVGATGVAVGSRLPAHDTSSSERVVHSPTNAAAVAELESEIESLRARNAELQRLHEAQPEPPKKKTAHKPEPADPDEIPAKVMAAAVDLGVPDDVLRTVWRARAQRGDKADLKKYGSAGFRAVVAIIRGGVTGKHLEALFEAAWDPALAGEERHLIETVEKGGGWRAGTWTALTALGVTDTPAARAFLLTQVEQREDAGHFMSAAKALGRLREPRAVAALARGMRNKEWTKQIRWPALHAITLITPDGAVNHLVDYVREPGGDLLRYAWHHLARIDADIAKREAETLLDGPRRDSWSSAQLWDLRRYAGRRAR